MVTLHGTGIPHVDTLGVSPWVQWGVIGVILLVGGWLMVDVRGRSGRLRRLVEDRPEELDGPLVVGRRVGSAHGSEAGDGVGLRQEGPLTPPTPLPPAAAGGRGETARARGRVLGQRVALPVWLNPIRVLTAVLGIGAGVEAMDRVRSIMELDAMLGTEGTFQVSRAAIWLTVLLCVGGALAMPAPKLAAVAFLGAAGLAAFFAVASWWESRLEWWGAEYALTAWSDLWVWVGVGLGLAVLALLGGLYRTRRET